MYSVEAIRVKVLRRWWSVLYPEECSSLALPWRQFLHGKTDQRSVVAGFLEIEEQCDMYFVWVVHVESWLMYATDEVYWIVKHDRHAGRSPRFNHAGMQACRPHQHGLDGGKVASRSGRLGHARFSVKSA